MANISVTLSPNALARIAEIKLKPENNNKHLRVTVLGGGCSGFQYSFAMDDKVENDDFKIADDNKLMAVIDSSSMEFLNNCVIDYISDLGGAYFKINNPNATSTCGCGTSFSV